MYMLRIPYDKTIVAQTQKRFTIRHYLIADCESLREVFSILARMANQMRRQRL